MGFSGRNTRVGCHSLLQDIFPSQGSTPRLLLGRRMLHRWASREAQAGLLLVAIIRRTLGLSWDHFPKVAWQVNPESGPPDSRVQDRPSGWAASKFNLVFTQRISDTHWALKHGNKLEQVRENSLQPGPHMPDGLGARPQCPRIFFFNNFRLEKSASTGKLDLRCRCDRNSYNSCICWFLNSLFSQYMTSRKVQTLENIPY